MQKHRHQINEGPSIRGHQIFQIETLSILVIDGIAIDLTPTEYTLVVTLLLRREKFQNNSEGPLDIYVSFEELQRSAGLSNRPLLAKHIYNASAKLWTADLSIALVNSYGYMVVFEAEGDANRFLNQATVRQNDIRREQQLCSSAG